MNRQYYACWTKLMGWCVYDTIACVYYSCATKARAREWSKELNNEVPN